MADSTIPNLTNYTPAVDTDVLPIFDTTGGSTKKITWANIKSTLKTYFDSIYGIGTVTSVASATTDATVSTPSPNPIITIVSAPKLTTTRSIYGNNFDGQAALTQIITSTYGGTGNGFTKFSGPTSSEKTFTLPDANATIARTDALQTFTGAQTFSNAVICTNNAITASGNAATVPVTYAVNTVTNNSAATLTITLTTASAVNRQLVEVLVLDASAATQTITWVNTEDSTVTAPTTSNGSTTLPLSVVFQYNTATSKWRCVGKA